MTFHRTRCSGWASSTRPSAAKPEKLEQVIERVELALEFVEPERLTLNPDCGFATTANGADSFDLAYEKLTTMCSAAASLRKRYG